MRFNDFLRPKCRFVGWVLNPRVDLSGETCSPLQNRARKSRLVRTLASHLSLVSCHFRSFDKFIRRPFQPEGQGASMRRQPVGCAPHTAHLLVAIIRCFLPSYHRVNNRGVFQSSLGPKKAEKIFGKDLTESKGTMYTRCRLPQRGTSTGQKGDTGKGKGMNGHPHVRRIDGERKHRCPRETFFKGKVVTILLSTFAGW